MFNHLAAQPARVLALAGLRTRLSTFQSAGLKGVFILRAEMSRMEENSEDEGTVPLGSRERTAGPATHTRDC